MLAIYGGVKRNEKTGKFRESGNRTDAFPLWVKAKDILQ